MFLHLIPTPEPPQNRGGTNGPFCQTVALATLGKIYFFSQGRVTKCPWMKLFLTEINLSEI